MEKKQNSECWYSEVCNMDNPCASCIRYIEMKYLMEHSGIPKAKQRPIDLYPDDIDYDSFIKLRDIKTDIVEFVENGKNLYICGGTGNGKTSWSIKLLLRYFDQVWAGNGFRVRGLFVHVPTILLQLKDFDNPLSPEYKQSLMSADIVVWDEIAGVGMSNYDYSQLLMYIDNRMLNEKSNIFTSNICRHVDLQYKMGSRIASRIWNGSTRIELKGRDKR